MVATYARLGAALLLLMVGSVPVWAQAPNRTVEAEQLFRDGRAALADGRVAEACAAFEGSQRIEPNAATLMNLADCRERNGQLASAWGSFLQAATMVRGDPAMVGVGKAAGERAARLEPRLSYLTINVADGSRVRGLEVRRNDDTLDPATWSRPIPVDGGTFHVEVRVDGRRVWSTDVEVAGEADRKTVDVPPLEPVVTPGPSAVPAPRPATDRSVRGSRLPSLVVGAVGVAVLGTTVMFELTARSAYDDYLHEPEGASREDLYQKANARRHIAQGLGVVGAVTCGAAMYLWVRTKHRRDRSVGVSPVVSPSITGVAVGGEF